MPLNDAKIRTLKPRERPYKLGDFDGLYLDGDANPVDRAFGI